MIDWQATEDYARSLDTYTLRGALKDAIDTAFAMDALDRAMPLGGNACRAGKYRDQCSVYRKVLNERK
jgi:hypothetical protein